MDQPQPQPGDAVEWTTQDHWTEMGKLYEQIAFQTKRIGVLTSVRDELQAINGQLRAENAAFQAQIESNRATVTFPMPEGAVGATLNGAPATRDPNGPPIQMAAAVAAMERHQAQDDAQHSEPAGLSVPE